MTRLVSFRHNDTNRFGCATDQGIVDLSTRLDGRYRSIRHMIEADGLEEVRRECAIAEADLSLEDVTFLPPVPAPEKILCVGVNYQNRNAEYKDGSSLPKYPSLFMRTPGSFVGHDAPIVRPPESDQFDYEGEIVIVIGKPGRRIPAKRADDHIFGLTLMNEGSVRDWLRHGKFNVTQGKNFDRSGSIGPWIVPRDEIGPTDELEIVTTVNGEGRQHGFTADLMFPFGRIVEYISTFTTLQPGDIIATGTPPGAGARFDPPRYLVPGDRVDVHSPAIGRLSNIVEDEA